MDTVHENVNRKYNIHTYFGSFSTASSVGSYSRFINIVIVIAIVEEISNFLKDESYCTVIGKWNHRTVIGEL